MNILVIDTAAEKGGAVTVLNEYYERALADLNNNYYFLTGKIKLQETSNIKNYIFDWSKNSWLHRLLFDYIYLPKYIKKNTFDEILSLQNIIVPFVHIPQTVYIHNALPFCEYRYKLRNNKRLWIYQNIIGYLIKSSAKEANKVIVQCDWMKTLLIDCLGIDSSNITVCPVEPEILKVSSNEPKEVQFFYPASEEEFKNHEIVFEACETLNMQGLTNFKVIFTLKGDETNKIKKLIYKAKEKSLPINFIGELSKKEVFSMYSTSVLLFPSYIETVGLPLVEASSINRPIVVSDLLYAHSALIEYENVRYFNPFDAQELASIMEEIIESGGKYA